MNSDYATWVWILVLIVCTVLAAVFIGYPIFTHELGVVKEFWLG